MGAKKKIKAKSGVKIEYLLTGLLPDSATLTISMRDIYRVCLLGASALKGVSGSTKGIKRLAVCLGTVIKTIFF